MVYVESINVFYPNLTRVKIVLNGVEYCRKKVYFMKKTLALVIVLVLICSSFAVYADTNSEYNCSDWAKESIDRAFNTYLLNSEKEYEFKTNISRLDFCELIFNLVVQTPYFTTWCEENLEEDETEFPSFTDKAFTDTDDDKVLFLHHIGIIN